MMKCAYKAGRRILLFIYFYSGGCLEFVVMKKQLAIIRMVLVGKYVCTSAGLEKVVSPVKSMPS